MIPAVGQRVGPYEILGRLGSGGMGLVFSAWDARLQRVVAIKLLREESLTPEMRGRFLQEARAASALNHPNICTVFDIGTESGSPYLVMELLRGETLRTCISAQTLTLEQMVAVGRQTSCALAAAHGRGVVHRDIKPANLFLVNRDAGAVQVKVLDFGLAKLQAAEAADAAEEWTSSGATVGTASYMSPEQVRGEPLDARSDLFSLGVVLYQMATGILPFRGATSALVFVQLLSQSPEPVREVNRSVPRDLDCLIHKLLQKDRAARFQTAAELVDALDRLDTERKPARPERVSHGRLKALLAAPKRELLLTPGANSAGHPLVHTATHVLLPTLDISQDVMPAPSNSLIRPVHRTISSATLRATAGGAVELASSEPIEAVDDQTNNHSASGAESVAELLSEPANREPTSQVWPKRAPWWIAAIAAALAVSGVLALKRLHHRAGSLPGAGGRTGLMVMPFATPAGEESLGMVVMEALRLELSQSSQLSVPTREETRSRLTRAGLLSNRQPAFEEAKRAAQAAGEAYVAMGQIDRAGDGSLHLILNVYSTDGVQKTSVQAAAVDRRALPAAIDQIATRLRMNLGESRNSVVAMAVPLRQEATADLDAFSLYVAAQRASELGAPMQAIGDLQQAVQRDPHFVQAWLLLARILTSMHADAGAADAAEMAQRMSAKTGERTRLLAIAAVAVRSSHELPRAELHLRTLQQRYNPTSNQWSDYARLLRRQGRFPEALAAAQTGLSLDPNNRDAAYEHTLSLLCLGNLETAARENAVAAARPNSRDRSGPLIDLLQGKPLPPVQGSGDPNELPGQLRQAEVLDAEGRLQEGEIVWRRIVGESTRSSVLASAAGVALARAALDRALVEDCAAASAEATEAVSYPRSEAALFDGGMAFALCGDVASARLMSEALAKAYPVSFAAGTYELVDLEATLQMHESGGADSAAQLLSPAKPAEWVAMTPYLRAVAQRKSGDYDSAIAGLQTALNHRGALVVDCPLLYPLLLLELGRDYAAKGDAVRSRKAYAGFLGLWARGEATSPLLQEALARSR